MTDVNETENNDKKIIADEEREKMLNKENAIREDISNKIEEFEKIDKEKELEKEKEAEGGGGDGKEDGVMKTGEVEKRKKQLEESQKESRLSSIRVPIGGIKIPGFLRSRSRDKNKEGEGTTEEGLDLLEQGGQKCEKTDKAEKSEGGLRATLARRLDTLAARNPFAKKDNAEQAETSATENNRMGLLDRIKLQSVTVLPKRFVRNNKDQKDGGDVDGEEKKPASPDDGMESVKLDGDGDEKDAEKAGLASDVPKRPIHLQWWDRLQRLTKHEKVIGGAIILLLLLLIIIISATSGGPMPTAPPVVNGKVITTTQCGPVEGNQDGDAFSFLGIPYAAPPLRERRWKPAQPLTSLDLCWQVDPYRAVNSSTNRQCWQEVSPNILNGYEDCLFLDLWTPEVRYINPMPVVVLIEAASFVGGPPNLMTPTPKIIHDREVVFVRPNFRLNVLGFLAATPLRSAVHPPSSGNYGLSDILVALKWVKTNIAHFGGDPEQVTLVGHRAGATLVTALSTSSAAKGLFKRAWASSGSAMYPGDDLFRSEQAAQNFVNNTCPIEQGQNQLECLLNAGPETLFGEVENSWRPPVRTLPQVHENETEKHDWLVLDGNILKAHVWEQLANLHTQLVIGTTAHSEASAALREELNKFGVSREEAVVKSVRNSLLGNMGLADEVLERYNTSWESYVSIISDIRTVCPLLAMARSQPNITFYVATQPRNHTGLGSLADVSLDMSAVLGIYSPQAEPQRTFVKSMQDVFYNFVNYGTLPALPKPAPAQPVLTIAKSAEWRSDYPNFGFWVEKKIVPTYGRRD